MPSGLKTFHTRRIPTFQHDSRGKSLRLDFVPGWIPRKQTLMRLEFERALRTYITEGKGSKEE